VRAGGGELFGDGRTFGWAKEVAVFPWIGAVGWRGIIAKCFLLKRDASDWIPVSHEESFSVVDEFTGDGAEAVAILGEVDVGLLFKDIGDYYSHFILETAGSGSKPEWRLRIIINAYGFAV
jgi:hypothetical protein